MRGRLRDARVGLEPFAPWQLRARVAGGMERQATVLELNSLYIATPEPRQVAIIAHTLNIHDTHTAQGFLCLSAHAGPDG